MASASTTSPPAAPEKPQLIASCHCGAVSLELPRIPEWKNECLCSICYKYGVWWSYYPRGEVLVTTAAGSATEYYIWGDRELEFHRCTKCGCVTHWWRVTKGREDPFEDMGVNVRLLDRKFLKGVEHRVEEWPDEGFVVGN